MDRGFVSRIAMASAIIGLMALGCATGGGDSTIEETGEWSQGSPTDSLAADDAIIGTPISVPELVTIYFDYDKAMLRDDQRPTLQGNADAVRENPEWRIVTIEGHCDERGSEEYNLALGEKRAETVKRYLVNLGIDGAKIETVSFGESKPAAYGHDESAWRLNRRGEFRVTR